MLVAMVAVMECQAQTGSMCQAMGSSQHVYAKGFSLLPAGDLKAEDYRLHKWSYPLLQVNYQWHQTPYGKKTLTSIHKKLTLKCIIDVFGCFSIQHQVFASPPSLSMSCWLPLPCASLPTAKPSSTIRFTDAGGATRSKLPDRRTRGIIGLASLAG